MSEPLTATFVCRDCLATAITEDGCAPSDWLSEKPPEAPVAYRCRQCAALHRGAMARVEAHAAPPVTSERLGLALLRLMASKARGVDFHTSFCSDERLLVVRVRLRPGDPVGRPFVGYDAGKVLEEAADFAESAT